MNAENVENVEKVEEENMKNSGVEVILKLSSSYYPETKRMILEDPRVLKKKFICKDPRVLEKLEREMIGDIFPETRRFYIERGDVPPLFEELVIEKAMKTRRKIVDITEIMKILLMGIEIARKIEDRIRFEVRQEIHQEITKLLGFRIEDEEDC